MRFLLFLVCIIAGMTNAWALPPQNTDPVLVEMEERSRLAIEVFRLGCFVNFGNREATMQYLDATYKRSGPEERVRNLRFVQADDGVVWTAMISPKMIFTIVSESSGRCHVITQRANGGKLHKAIKNLAMDVRDSMSFSVVDYKGAEPDKPIQYSNFEVKAPDGALVLTVAVTTKTDTETQASDGVISLWAPGK